MYLLLSISNYGTDYKDTGFHYKAILFPLGDSPPMGQTPLIIEDSCSYSDTPQSVGLLWTCD